MLDCRIDEGSLRAVAGGLTSRKHRAPQSTQTSQEDLESRSFLGVLVKSGVP